MQGAAKELIRELTPHQLQHGDVDPAAGQQLTGLMLLVSVLARRYAPLEAENTIKSIAEFLSFRRQPGEGIDTVLVRFDILRSRAQARAGFAVNWTGLSWLLLQSLGLNAGCGTVCLLLLVVKCPRMNLIWRIDGTHQKVVSFEGGSDG